MKEKCKGCSFQKIITVTDKEEGRVEKREKRRNEGEKAVVRTLAFALGEKRTWEALSILALAACGESGWELHRHGRGCILHNDCLWPVSLPSPLLIN